MSDFRFPFGQYRGWPLTSVPPSYLDWVRRHKPIPRVLRTAIDRELSRLALDRSRPGYPATFYEAQRN